MLPTDTYREWKGWASEEFASLSHADHIYFLSELDGILNNLEGKTLLELGFGNGGFLAFCRELGANAVGIEIDESLVDRARSHGFEAHTFSNGALESLEIERFDAIFAFDVLEHIPYEELLEVLTRMRRLLKPDGILLARFPSGDSPFSGAMYNGDSTHRTLIGSGKLKQIAIFTGFTIHEIRGARLPISGLGLQVGLRRLFVVFFRKIIKSILIPTYYSNSPRIIDPNLVCILKKDKNYS